MAIQVSRNETGNCILFSNSSNPVYWNNCLRAELDSVNNDLINIINEPRTESSGVISYEFFNIPYTEFTNNFGEGFSTSQLALDYINATASVSSNVTTIWFDTDTTVDFTLDSTQTTILASNGDTFPINSITAVQCFRGNVRIVSSRGAKVFYTNMYEVGISINGVSVSSVQTEALAELNALFTSSASGTQPPNPVVENTESSATVNLLGQAVVDGSSIDFNAVTGMSGVYTSETIQIAHESFKVTGLNTSGYVAMGLTQKSPSEINDLLATGTYQDIIELGAVYSGSRVQTSTLWTTSYGGYDNTMHSVLGESELNVVIDDEGKFRIQDSNGINSVRSYDALPENNYRFVILSTDVAAGFDSDIKIIQRTDITAPVLRNYFIESPDTEFHYPLFKTQEEANYQDTLNGGSGTSVLRTYVDEPTSTNWYSPSTRYTLSGSAAPSGNFARIATEDDGNYIPFAEDSSIDAVEGTAINYTLVVTGHETSASASGVPSGLIYNTTNHTLQGTAPTAGTYNITITLANGFGSRIVTLTVNAISSVSFNSTKCLDITGSYNHGSVMTGTDVNHPLYAKDGDVTLGFWMKSKVSTISSTKYLLRSYSSNDVAFDLQFNSSERLKVEVERSGYAYLEFPVADYLDNEWHFFVVTFEAPATNESGVGYISSGVTNWVTDNLKLYVDGVAVAHYNGYGSGTYTVDNDAYVWGTSSVNELHFFNLASGYSYAPVDMQYDDIFFYSKVLTPAEITTAYNSGTPYNMELIQDSDLYWYWQMGDNTSSLFPNIVDSKGHQDFVLESFSSTQLINR